VGVATPAATTQGHGEDDNADDPAPCTSHDSSLAVVQDMVVGEMRPLRREPEAGIGGSDVLIIVPIVALAISMPWRRGSQFERRKAR
jgi:hypothetical protein